MEGCVDDASRGGEAFSLYTNRQPCLRARRSIPATRISRTQAALERVLLHRRSSRSQSASRVVSSRWSVWRLAVCSSRRARPDRSRVARIPVASPRVGVAPRFPGWSTLGRPPARRWTRWWRSSRRARWRRRITARATATRASSSASRVRRAPASPRSRPPFATASTPPRVRTSPRCSPWTASTSRSRTSPPSRTRTRRARAEARRSPSTPPPSSTASAPPSATATPSPSFPSSTTRCTTPRRTPSPSSPRTR